MGKGSRIRATRRTESITTARNEARATIVPVESESLKYGFSYWLTGVLWKHDKVIVEPFCAVYGLGGTWQIANLSYFDLEYYDSKLLITDGEVLIFEDRVSAITVCDAMRNEKELLDSFTSYMSDDELLEYLANKEKQLDRMLDGFEE